MLPVALIKKRSSYFRLSPPRPTGRWYHLTLILMILFLPLLSHATDTIKIASIYAHSGPAAKANQSSVKGVRLAVDEINSAGGISGRPIVLLELDNQSTPIGSKVAADLAVSSDVVAIIGAAFSSHSVAVATVAQRHQIPMITNVSTNPSVTRIGDYIFRVCFNDVIQGQVMAKFAREELQSKGVVTIYNMASDYSIGISATFEQAFVRRSGLMLAKIPYKARQPNFRNIISLAISAQPDAVFIGGHTESGRIIGEAIKNGLSAIPLGGDGWDEPSFYEMGGKHIQEGYYTTHWNQKIASASSRRFVNRYGQSGMLWAPTALAYDAVHLLANAIKRAGSTLPEAVKGALSRTDRFRGVTGTISFDEKGDPIKSVVIMKIEAGEPKFLKEVDSNYVNGGMNRSSQQKAPGS